MSYEIEKDVPIGSRASSKYPFKDMDVGDSFFADDVSGQSLSSNSQRYGKRHDVKFSVRKEDGGFRVWRVE